MESILAEAHDHLILIFLIRVIHGLRSGVFGTSRGLLQRAKQHDIDPKKKLMIRNKRFCDQVQSSMPIHSKVRLWLLTIRCGARAQVSRDVGLEWGHVADCKFRKHKGVKTERM